MQSVFDYTTGIVFEVILVDNASTECDPAVFQKTFPTIRLLRNEINTGFAGGNNLGLQYAAGKYVLLLNSDIELKDNAVLQAFRFMESKPCAGVCSTRLLFPNGQYQSVAQRFPSIKYKLAELLRVQKFLGKSRGGRLLLGSFFSCRETVKVDWVWGAFFMFRREMLDSLPGRKLNDDYFMYGEDMQWCFDFRKRGWEIWFLGTVEAIHHLGGSHGSKQQFMDEGLEIFYKKNYGRLNRNCIRYLDKLLRF